MKDWSTAPSHELLDWLDQHCDNPEAPAVLLELATRFDALAEYVRLRREGDREIQAAADAHARAQEWVA